VESGLPTLKKELLMQLHFQNLIPKKKRLTNDRAVVLVERDLDIIQFILDMKFASIQNIFEKFYKVTKFGVKTKDHQWATKRLRALEKAGYLKGIYSFSLRDKFYLVTMRGYSAVARAKPEEVILKPNMVIDHRIFDHDRYVLMARIELENRKAATSWISDKRLRANQELAGGLSLNNVPDGIFINPSGERIAFEFELGQKSLKDYLEKIKKYVLMMRSDSHKVRVFERVIFVCAKLGAYNLLVRETKIYGELFEIQKMSDFFLNNSALGQKVEHVEGDRGEKFAVGEGHNNF
jgi:hypothetical protein